MTRGVRHKVPEPSTAAICEIGGFRCVFGVGDRGGGVYGDALYIPGMAQRATELLRYASSAGVG